MDTIYPVNAVAGAPAYSGRMLRQAGSVAFAGATVARPLGARSGVRPSTSAATVTATSTTWSCGSFAGVIDAQAAAEAGPYSFAFDAADGGALTAANASNPRVDIVYVQVDDPSESDGTSAPAVRRGYLAGVAAATPSAPTAPARSFVVAQINVPKSGGGSPTVSWVAPVAVAAGGVLPVRTKALLDAIPGYKGQHAEVTADTSASKNGGYVSDGTGWFARTSLAYFEGTRNLTASSAADLVSTAFAAFGDAATVGTNAIVIQRTGWFDVEAMVVWESNSSGSRVVEVTVDNVTATIPIRSHMVADSTSDQSLATVRRLLAGQVLRLRLYQNSGATLVGTGTLSVNFIGVGVAVS